MVALPAAEHSALVHSQFDQSNRLKQSVVLW